MKWNQHLPQARLLVLRRCFVCFISIILEENLRICMQNTGTNRLPGSSETSETHFKENRYTGRIRPGDEIRENITWKGALGEEGGSNYPTARGQLFYLGQ